MLRVRHVTVGTAAAVILAGGLLVWAQEKKENRGEKKEMQSSERSIKENEVPAAALAALKKLAGSATFTEFAEEVEHGHKFYEASWKGPDGNVDGLVTEAGDVVEIEEAVPAEKVPAVVRAEVEKQAGKDARPTFEKKTMILYEIHYRKGDKVHELIFTPYGSRYHERGEEKKLEKHHEEEEDEDEDDHD